MPNNKNGGIAPICDDSRKMYVPVGCGVCIECRKKRANEWKVRLNEEIKANKKEKGLFVTLTFSKEEYQRLYNVSEAKNDEEMLTFTIRRFKERVRKRYATARRMWLIQEYGEDYDRVHLHGIIWGMDEETVKREWKHGFVYCGHYVGEKTINYVIKYCLKADKKRPNWKPKIWCSPGLGNSYKSNYNTFKGNETKEDYRTASGARVALPMYYRNKIYTDEQREFLWIKKLEKNERYVLKGRYLFRSQEDIDEFKSILRNAQEYNERLGFGGIPNYWNYKKRNTGNLNIWKSQNKSVILHDNYKDIGNGEIKTYQGDRNENGILKLGHENTETGNNIPPAGGLLNCENLYDREVKISRLWNEAERYRDLYRWSPTRKTPHNMDREYTNIDIVENRIMKTQRPNADPSIHCGNTDNKSTYECVDIDTGEVFTGGLKDKTYKTINYEKRSRKITRPDGSKTKIWKTIRYVQQIGKEQYQLDFG